MRISKIYLLILFFRLATVDLDAQNLVLNPSFEDFSICPDAVNQIDNSDFWISPTDGDADYLNQCAISSVVGIPTNGAGFSAAFEGNAYAGIITYANADVLPFYENYREYITGNLSEPLIADRWYRVGFYVSKGDNYQFATDNFGAYFSDTVPELPGSGINWPPLADPPYNLVPQIQFSDSIVSDTSGWVLLIDSFKASGGETFITIGNFYNDVLTDTLSNPDILNGFSYYYLDQVSVEQIFAAPIIVDDYVDADNISSIWIDVLSNDSDEDGLLDPGTLTLLTAPVLGSANADVSGEVFYEADFGEFGLDSLTYRVCDNDGLCGQATIYINVVDSSLGIQAIDDEFSTLENQDIFMDVLINDVEGDYSIALDFFSLLELPDNGVASVDTITGQILYVPNADFVGMDELSYLICDQGGFCDSALVTITVVENTEITAVCVDDVVEVIQRFVVIDVVANDSTDSPWDYATLELQSMPQEGIATILPSGLIRYMLSNPFFSGTDIFDYRICNTDGECSQAEVILSIETAIVPEAVTPNGDGINDKLVIGNLENWNSNQLVIYNRREQQVLNETDYQQSWDGAGLQEGVYFYILELESQSGEQVLKKGTIVLIRGE